MSKKWSALTALAVLAAGVAVMTPLKAADHLDGIQTGVEDDVVKDGAADITDLYAFTPTGRAGRLALIMNVGPLGSAIRFSDKVEYAFRIRPYDGNGAPGSISFDLTKNLDIRCKSSAAGTEMTCSGPNGLTKTALVIDTSAGSTCVTTDTICVFAGPRSDPFFLDFQALGATLKADAGSQFCEGDGGTATFGNFFDKKNVLSIVIEVDVARLLGTDAGVGELPPLGVAAETTRSP